MKHDSVRFVWGALILCAGLALTNSCRYPPFNDFGEWIYQAYVAKYLTTHSLSFCELKRWPVPNSISEVIMGVLMIAFSPIVGAKVFLSSYLILGSLLAFGLSRIYGGSYCGALFVLLSSLMVLPTPLWTGETNYQVGLLLLSAYMFWISKRQDYTLTDFCTDAAFGVVIFFCHAICLVIFVVFILLKAIEKRRLFSTCLSLVPAGLLSAFYLYFNSHFENTEEELAIPLSGVLDVVAYRLYTFSKLGPYSNMVIGNSGDFERSRIIYYTGVGLNLVFCALLLFLVIKWLYSQKGNWFSAEVATCIFCITIYLWNPTKVLRVATIGERFLLPAVLIAVLGSSPASNAKRIAGWISGVACIVMLYWLAILPRAPIEVGVPNNAVSKMSTRFKFLYWHRPFLFSQSAAFAEQAYRTHSPPQERIAFGTSLITNKK